MNAVPPKINATTTLNRRIIWATMVVAGLGAAAVLYQFNPATSRFYPVCHFHQLTGLNCPGCGMTRAIYALLHADLATAWRNNALLVSLLGWGSLRGVWFGLNRLRGRTNGAFFKPAWLWSWLIVALLFTVLRNLPTGAMLSP